MSKVILQAIDFIQLSKSSILPQMFSLKAKNLGKLKAHPLRKLTDLSLIVKWDFLKDGISNKLHKRKNKFKNF